MEESKETSGMGIGESIGNANKVNVNSRKASKKKFAVNEGGDSEQGEVLFKVGPFRYRLPGKRQRTILGLVVVGLNLLLLLAVALYFYNPTFHEFVFTVGRD